MEYAFRQWTDKATRRDIQFSRNKLFIIFLLIRYTGAKLNEVLTLDLEKNLAPDRQTITFHGNVQERKRIQREVHLSKELIQQINNLLHTTSEKKKGYGLLKIDPGFVRRQFYERARECGFPKQLGGPEMIRKARAVELMQSNIPLPAVQMILGHSTPNLTSAYVSFSQEDIQQIAKLFIEKEFTRKTSARNTFFGKIQKIEEGDIQARISLITIEGHKITTVITNGSIERLGLKPGRLVTAEVKAPWVILHATSAAPECSAENRFKGIIKNITSGKINTECIVQISEGTELCAIISSTACRHLSLKKGDHSWVIFNDCSVILHVD